MVDLASLAEAIGLRNRGRATQVQMSAIDLCLKSRLLSVTPMRKVRTNMIVRWSHRLAAFALALMLACSAFAAKAMPRNERHETRHEIDHLEDHWRSALMTANLGAMDSLLADDYMAITPNGMLQSKDETLASLRNGKVHIKSLQITDRKVRFYGTTALVTSKAEVNGSTPEGELSGSYRYTRVYARDPKGVWRIVSFEANKIRDEDHK